MTKILVIKSTESDIASKVADELLVKFEKEQSMQYDLIESPSSTEVPMIASMNLESGGYDCIICLGVILEDSKNPINSETNYKNVSGILSDFGTHYLMPMGSGIAYCKNKSNIEEVANEYFSRAIENTIKLLNIKHRISLLEDERFQPQQKHN